MRTKVKAKNDSGITLVALIITIIILVILAALTVKALFNDKLVDTAIKAGEDYKLAQGQEMNELGKLNNKLINATTDIGKGEASKPSGIVGAISFGELTWNSGKASVVVTKNSEDSYTIEYKVTNKDNVVTREYTPIASGEIITDLNIGDLVTARLTDGVNHGKPADLNVEDGNGPTKPIIAITGGTKGNGDWYKESDVVLTITPGTDEESGVDRTTYVVSGMQNTVETAGTSVTISTNGTNTIIAYTYDKAGNKTASEAKVIELDKDGPQNVSLVQKIGETVKGKKANVTATVGNSFSGIASYKYEYKLSTAGSYSEDTGNTHTVTALTDTYEYTNLTEEVVNNLQVTVTDNAGNSKTATCNVTPQKVLNTTTDPSLVGKTVEYNPISGTFNTEGKKGITLSGSAEYSGYGFQYFKTQGQESGETAFTWKIWNADSENLYLIADKGTTKKLYLQGVNGYNNGVKLLDDICKACYSNSTYGAIARNLKIEDVINTAGITAANNLATQYGTQPQTYNFAYPKVWADNENTVEKAKANMSEPYAYTSDGTLQLSDAKPTWTFREYIISTSTFKANYGDLVVGTGTSNGTYWLSSRCVHPASINNVNFALQCVLSSRVYFQSLHYYSWGATNERWA